MAAEAEADLSTAHANGTNSEANGAAGQGKLTAAQKRRARLKKGKAAKQAVRSGSSMIMRLRTCTSATRPAEIRVRTSDKFLFAHHVQASQPEACRPRQRRTGWHRTVQTAMLRVLQAMAGVWLALGTAADI